MKINLEKFNQLVNEKLLSVQKHNTLDLLIWNYTHKCQYDKAWTEETMMARGLITDLGGNIVARPFKKFFNWEEKPESIPAGKPIIYEKMDGSLGVQYYDGDKVCIATRGSFNSDQAKWATKWIQNTGLTKKDFPPGYTFLYEIIYPENRIVVDYKGRSGLVMLAMIDTESSIEAFVACEQVAQNLRMSTPRLITYHDVQEVIKQAKALDGNQEGYVFYWPESNNFRVKMKGTEYVRLHRLITGFSTKSIWECLMNNQNLDDILKDIPDEFYDWVKAKEREMRDQFYMINQRAMKVHSWVFRMPTRKEQAEYMKEKAQDVMAEVFRMLDGKNWDSLIWKKLRPKYELPFKQDIDA